ncbi:MAG: lanthionine synthetase C family protein [Paraglaciecola sp.]|uniref:lanthionine synthetase C family protein n=1 Tax=Paraglaciecola sp. TaxID=1920173 RepID=UPI003297B4B8
MSSQSELSNSKKIKIEKLLKILSLTVQSSSNDVKNLGLLTGLTGELLFLWKISQHDNNYVDENIIIEKFQFLQNNLSLATSNINLSFGLIGLGWFLEYINQAQTEDYDPELCEDIDAMLLKAMSIESWGGEIEMVMGLAGMSVYGARRHLKSDLTVFYEKLINHFENMATQVSENTITWLQPSYSIYRLDKEHIEKPEYNFGLAHGVPGIIAAIVPALKIPSLYSQTKKMLIQSCDWLLQQQLNKVDKRSYFSSSSNSTHSTRLAWCYGDLTIALTLYRVGKALNLPTYMEIGIKISLHASCRDEIQALVNDAGLCHGSAGLMLIFKLLYQETGLKEFQQATVKWLDYTLDLFDKKGLPGLYKMSGYDKSYSESTDFLEGYAGIGLCLLATLDGEADWTDCLMLS